ncbi:MAG: cupin domain-containing protein [Bacteroidetes bacterium]|nr:MAG: cupin domain-containing protein [Bacteroidota bacterium]
MQDAAYWIEQLDLSGHPEGGYFRQVYQSDEQLMPAGLPARYEQARAAGTGIYFLLTEAGFSAFHRLQTDELWHYYTGTVPVDLWVIQPGGELAHLRLGPDPGAGMAFQLLVPRGTWFAAETPGGFALTGCTMAPGFDFADFELGARAALQAAYPKHAALIKRLTR